MTDRTEDAEDKIKIPPVASVDNPYANTSARNYALVVLTLVYTCLLYTSPSPRDRQKSRMPSSA